MLSNIPNDIYWSTNYYRYRLTDLDIDSSTTDTVTGSRNPQTSRVSLSARPQITYIYPEINRIPLAVVGFDAKFKVEGYNFGTDVSLYISANGDTFTNAYSSVSAFDLFSTIPNLSSLYPSFTGFKIPSGDFGVTTNNTLNFTLCSAQATGSVNLIIVNSAGYGTLYGDMSARLINVVL